MENKILNQYMKKVVDKLDSAITKIGDDEQLTYSEVTTLLQHIIITRQQAFLLSHIRERFDIKIKK